MTSTASYADRYLAAVAQAVPAASRAEILDEVRASIADQVEPLLDAGVAHDDAERDVVAGLGDPIDYAASLTGRGLWLIGPRYYAAWLRLVRLLLWIVPPCGVFGVVLGQLIARAPVGEVIGSGIAVLVGAIVHVCFWTTLVFVLIERSGAARDALPAWTPDQLPPRAHTGLGRGDLIATLVYLALLTGALLWDRFVGFVFDAGTSIPVLAPGLWPAWIIALLVLMLGEALLAVAVHRRGGWSTALAVMNTVLAIAAGAVLLTLLLRGELINPGLLAFITEAGGEGFAQGQQASAAQGGVFGILGVLIGVGVVAFPLWDIVDGWLKLRRQRAVSAA